jgi:hypothetical protein
MTTFRIHERWHWREFSHRLAGSGDRMGAFRTGSPMPEIGNRAKRHLGVPLSATGTRPVVFTPESS